MRGYFTTPQETVFMRNQLQLRYNTGYNCWEVFTRIHGQIEFKWIKISKAVAEWYWDNFPELRSDKKITLH